MGEGGGGEDAVKWNILVFAAASEMRTCSVGQHLQTAFWWCLVSGGVTLALSPFDSSFDSLKLSCRGPQQNFARPSVKDSRLQTVTSLGRGCLLAGVLDSWASCGLLCPVLCWIGLTPVLMTSSMTTKVRNDVIYTSSKLCPPMTVS